MKLRVATTSKGVGSLIVRPPDTTSGIPAVINALAFSPSTEQPARATAKWGGNSAAAVLHELDDYTQRFFLSLSLTDRQGAASTAADKERIFQPIEFVVAGSPGESGAVTVRLFNELKAPSGSASATCLVNGRPVGVYTQGDAMVLSPSPTPTSESISMPFKVGDTFSFGTLLIGNPGMKGPVTANFVARLRLVPS